MANRNLKASLGTVSASTATYKPGTEIEGWILHNLDTVNTLVFNVGGVDVNVKPGGWKRVDCIDPQVSVTGTGEYNILALEDGEAEIERLASGGGGASTIGALSNVKSSTDDLVAADHNRVLLWDGNTLEFVADPLDKRNRLQTLDFEEVTAGSPPSGPFTLSTPHQLASGYEVFLAETGASQGSVVVRLPQMSAASALTPLARSTRIYIKDAAGLAGSHSLTIEPHTADAGATIDGAASVSISTAYGALVLVTDGSSGWFIL
jgi:hypothetical protein